MFSLKYVRATAPNQHIKEAIASQAQYRLPGSLFVGVNDRPLVSRKLPVKVIR